MVNYKVKIINNKYMNKEKSRFELASELNVSEKTEKKKNLTYLSWTWAWIEFKKIYPEATYLIKKFGENSLPYVYDEKTGYMVFTEVITEKETLEMWLPVMDGANKAMKATAYTYTTKYGEKNVEAATMFDINKTIMRCLTKNLAMFGLGLYIYAGEDLPEVDNSSEVEELMGKVKDVETLEGLRDFYKKHSGKGKELDKAITDRSKELKETK